MARINTIAAALIVVVLSVVPAYGQVDQLDRFERQLEQIRRETQEMVTPEVPPDQRMYVDFGGNFSFNFLALDDPTGRTHMLNQFSLTGYGRLNIDGVHDFFVRGRTAYHDYHGNDFGGRGDEWVGPRLERAVYRFDLARSMSAYEGRSINGNITVQGGRQLVHWMSGMVLSRELDGGMVSLHRRPFTLTAFGGRTPHDTVDIDPTRRDYDDDTRRNFFGGMLSVQVGARHRPYVFGIVQDDDNRDRPVLFGPTTTRHDYNSYYIGVGSRGNITRKLLYAVEGIYQGGDTLSSPFDNVTFAPVAQTRDRIEAFAFNAVIDYLPGDRNRSRLSGEIILASGDRDRLHTTNTFGGNQRNTTDRAFNAFGLMNTGLAFNPNVSNLLMVRTGAATFPLAGMDMFDRLQVGVDLFFFNKLTPDAPISEPTGDGRWLGFEADVYAIWQVTSDLILSARYGAFIPGSTIESGASTRHFLFTGVTIAF